MSGTTESLASWEMAERLLACVSDQLAATEAGSPARALVVPGAQVAWDVCECGQLTVHTATMYPSDTFPAQKLTAPFDKCEAAWTVVEYVVTILRCVPVQDDRGNAPAATALHAAARVDHIDRWAVRRGVTCCFEVEDARARTPRLIQEQLGVGGEGRCAGSELHLLVALRNCDPCDGPD